MTKNTAETYAHWLRAGLAVLALLTACTSAEQSPTDRGKGGGHETAGGPIVCRLKWLYNASVAGEIWAEESGIFRDRGLDVELREGGPEQDAIKDLELGRAHFGIASADQVLRAADKGAPVVVLAQIFQINPLQWIYTGGKGVIKDARDLKGLRVGVTYGGNDEAILMSLMRKYAIGPDDVDLYAVHYDFGPFWRGEVDLWPVYRNTQGILLQERLAASGEKTLFFDPDRYGIRFVANSLVTSRKVLSQHPQLVREFTGAVLTGWKQAMDPAGERSVAEAVGKMEPGTPRATIRRQLAETRKLVAPDGLEHIGRIDREAWQQTADILLAEGLISKPAHLDAVLRVPGSGP
jgi:NitT/TauT family transport system substrate-binding protein